MTGLLVVEMIIGYEWLVSGLVKLVKGGFPSGLAEELLGKMPAAATWYGSLVRRYIIPNAVSFGYLIEISELLAGIALIIGPLVWILAWDRVSDRIRIAILLAITAAAIGGALLAVNLHLANGASHPWLLPGDSFDEGIDLDSILPGIQIVIAIVSSVALRRLRRDRSATAGVELRQESERRRHHYRRITKDNRMHRLFAHARSCRPQFTTALIVLSALGITGAARRAEAQMSSAPAAASATEEEEIPHPFFTHMGLPEGVGVWSIRAAALSTRADGRQTGDFAFHVETGITNRIGVHIRNDQFRRVPRTEAMFQFAAITSKDGMSGFAPIIEFNFATRSGAGSRINTLAGFTSMLANSRVAFNQALHYDPREDAVDGSIALVARAGKRVFPVVELLGAGARGMRPIGNLLAGLKVRVRPGVNLGFAYQIPLTRNRDFSSQAVGESEFGWTTRR